MSQECRNVFTQLFNENCDRSTIAVVEIFYCLERIKEQFKNLQNVKRSRYSMTCVLNKIVK